MFDWRRIALPGIVICLCGFLILLDDRIKDVQLSVMDICKPVASAHREAMAGISGLFERLLAPFHEQGVRESELRGLREALEMQRAENSLLKRSLSREESLAEIPDLSPLRCKMIYRDPAGAAEVFAIDVGANSGVRDGMAVCSGRTIVGRVYRAGRTVSLVVGVRHPMFRVPVVVESGGDRGVAWGTGNGLEVRFVPIEAEIASGGAVVSSDDNADVPARFLIGRVSDCKRDPVRLLWIIKVAPAPGSRNCEDLYVPLNWGGPAPVYVPKELK